MNQPSRTPNVATVSTVEPPPAQDLGRPHPPAGSHGDALPESRVSARTAMIVSVVLLLLGAIAAVAGILGRRHQRTTVANETTALAAPDVLLTPVKTGAPSAEIVLPGNIYPFSDAPIYARTNGYLTHWYFDIGAHVRKGQLLATISTPEVDQQLAQARADLATAEANAGLARDTAKRYQDLLAADAVTRQETENFSSQALSTNAAVRAQQANVMRLQQLQGFQQIYAPFNGVITSRSIDTGQLIDQGAARELFHMASTDTLRVYVNVPQLYSRDAVPGTKAQLTFAEYPGRTFEGSLVRTSKSIDLNSRTLLAEVDVDNRKGEITPGAYTEVHMRVNQPVATVVIPVSALLFRKEGLRVATVEHAADGSDVAKLMPITIGHDDGDTVQVVSGLDPQMRIIADPPDSVVDGEKVHVLEHPDAGQSGASKPESGS